MFQQMSRRSVLKAVSGASFAAACVVVGCAKEPETDPTITVGEPKSAVDSVRGKPKGGGPVVPPSNHRVKAGPG
jgi:hypothetical protein